MHEEALASTGLTKQPRPFTLIPSPREPPRILQGEAPTFEELVELVAWGCGIDRAQLLLRAGGTRREQVARQVLGYLMFKDARCSVKSRAERFALVAAMLGRPEQTIRYMVRVAEESRSPEVTSAIARIRAQYAPNIRQKVA